MISRILFSALFLLSGSLHLVIPGIYIRIVPPLLPAPLVLVYLSGVAEIAGGLGLLLPVTRHAAAWGLVILLLAVWPANIYMAAIHLPSPGIFGQSWVQWLRVPL
jgi:uncharacterized membrane protein